MRVVGADEVHLVAEHALEPHPDIGLDVLHDVPDMKRAVGVRQRGGDEQVAGAGGHGKRQEIRRKTGRDYAMTEDG